MSDRKGSAGFRAVWRRHVLVGVPLAAFLHSVLQFAYEGARDAWLFPIHFLLGVVVGSVILAPAFSLQAIVFQLLAGLRAPRPLVIALCGAFQACLVALWADRFGIEPSLAGAGHFRLTPPMIVAGFLAGVVAALAASVPAPRGVA